MKILNRWKAWSGKKKVLWGVALAALVLLAAAGARTYVRKKAQAAIREGFSQVETVQVSKQNLINSISVTGTIASADSRDVQAIAKNVEVLEVNGEVGDYVNEGDVIVVLDSTDLELSLTQAQNSQALSQYKENKTIETAEENYTEAVEDGTTDYQKALKNAEDAKEALQEADADLEEAASSLKRQEARLSEAKEKQAEAYAALQVDDTNSDLKEAYAAASSAVSAAQTEYTSRHQKYLQLEDTDDKAIEAYENAVEALEEAEKKNNRNIDSAGDELEQSQMERQYSNSSSTQSIENLQDQIESCTVKAPRSGVITALNVEVGDTYMGEGNTLFTVADEKNFVVSASVDEYDISSIVKDQTAAVIVEALGDEELPATVSFVSPTAEKAEYGSSAYSIEIALDDENTDLRIGMTAKASVVLDAAYDVLTVPYDCVTTDEDGNSTLAIDQNGERTEIPVTLGMQGDYYVEVSGEGLDETTLVYYSTAMANNAASGGDDGESGMMFDMGGGAPGGGGGMPGNRGGGMPGGPGGF